MFILKKNCKGQMEREKGSRKREVQKKEQMCRRERGKGDRDKQKRLKESEGEVQKRNGQRHAREEKEMREIGTAEERDLRNG